MDISPILLVFLGLMAIAFIGALRWQAKEDERVARKRFLAKLAGKFYNGHED